MTTGSSALDPARRQAADEVLLQREEQDHHRGAHEQRACRDSDDRHGEQMALDHLTSLENRLRGSRCRTLQPPSGVRFFSWVRHLVIRRPFGNRALPGIKGSTLIA